MTTGQFIIISVVVLFLLILIIFPSFRKRLKVLCGGFLNLIVEDNAKTPEGAKAIYNQAIEEAEEKFRTVANVYKRVSGKLVTFKQQKENLTEQLKSVESACESFVKQNRMDQAEIYAEKRMELKDQLKQIDAAIAKLEPSVKSARDAYEEQERDLNNLKRKSKSVVEGMILNQQLEESLSDVNSIAKTSATSKLLDAVEEAYKDSNDLAEGTKLAYENRVSTKMRRAEVDARKMASDDYLSQLKAKYNK